MTKSVVLWGVVVSCLGAMASSETDWSAKSGAVTIPAGETWYADESDMAYVNALSSITLEAASGETAAGTLVFRNTTTLPAAGILAGAGVVRKTGDSTWTSYGNAQTDFTGDFHVAGGLVAATNSTAFGCCATAGVGGLYVDQGGAVSVAVTTSSSSTARCISRARAIRRRSGL